jgi:hypothetical protein
MLDEVDCGDQVSSLGGPLFFVVLDEAVEVELTAPARTEVHVAYSQRDEVVKVPEKAVQLLQPVLKTNTSQCPSAPACAPSETRTGIKSRCQRRSVRWVTEDQSRSSCRSRSCPALSRARAGTSQCSNARRSVSRMVSLEATLPLILTLSACRLVAFNPFRLCFRLKTRGGQQQHKDACPKKSCTWSARRRIQALIAISLCRKKLKVSSCN